MSSSNDPRKTQNMKRPSSAELQHVFQDPFSIMHMVENGDEPRRIIAAIAKVACHQAGVSSCAIYLPIEQGRQDNALVARDGTYIFPDSWDEPLSEYGNITDALPVRTRFKQRGELLIHDIKVVGVAIGFLIVHAPTGVSPQTADILRDLAFQLSLIYERQKLSQTLQHFLDRLQVLNELNQLIAGNIGLDRILKNLARESAFRFAADVSLTLLLDHQLNTLLVKGGYGCSPSVVPESVSMNSGFLGQVMRVGGHLSLSGIDKDNSQGLGYLVEQGIRAVDACCLEVRGEILGAILIGFRRDNPMSQNDLTRFEEFSQAAAVAVTNAITRDKITAYTERLEELVESRTADLAIQTARAEEANQAKSRFLANMSHELRTPLTAIVGYSSVLADGLFGEMNEKQRDALGAITRSSDHLKNLIDDVLNLARVESGKETPEPKAISVKDVLTQANKLMQQTALSKGVTISPTQYGEGVDKLSLYCDPKHIHQIIINLMSNAVKYTPTGGRVDLLAEHVSDKLRIAVKDTGVGISPEKMKKLFERFERGEDSYSKSQIGTGIGLNLTRHLVEINGGRIGVESDQGRGSIFWILMPLAIQETEQIITPPTEEVIPRLDGLSVIVVDDNLDTLQVLEQILLSVGAKVRIAESVRAGLSHFESDIPDIVLTDLAIPGESGLVLIDAIRKHNGDAGHVPILVLSACAFESDRQTALDAGASFFLPKPFRPQEVIRNVRNLTLQRALGQTTRPASSGHITTRLFADTDPGVRDS